MGTIHNRLFSMQGEFTAVIDWTPWKPLSASSPKPPNQAMQRTATDCATTFSND
jgi:hypothetical protein